MSEISGQTNEKLLAGVLLHYTQHVMGAWLKPLSPLTLPPLPELIIIACVSIGSETNDSLKPVQLLISGTEKTDPLFICALDVGQSACTIGSSCC